MRNSQVLFSQLPKCSRGPILFGAARESYWEQVVHFTGVYVLANMFFYTQNVYKYTEALLGIFLDFLTLL